MEAVQRFGTLGEDGSLQGLLRMANMPFVGAGVLGSAVSMDKDVTKRLLRDAGLIQTEVAAPAIRRESTSRPNSSVPSQCSALGAASFSRKESLSGS